MKFDLDPTSETHQNSICPPSLFLESWRKWRFLMSLEVVSYDRDHSSEAYLKVSSRSNMHQKPCQDSTCPPSLFLESWRTWRFLINLEVVSDDKYHPSKADLKVSTRSVIRNLVQKKCIFVVKSIMLHTHIHTYTRPQLFK